ncbi:MAG: patatin-like phospholipase family protein [Caulobacteraceae bacterium]
MRALREAGVPIDFVGGASMGGIIGAGVALGWDGEELDRRMRKAFVESSPLDDIALPMIAMTRGRKVAARLAEHFGDVEIPDMPLPFFCVSSDLTAGVYRLQQRGLLRRVLEASVALPGILPPVIEGDHVLVDGGVTKNFPTDIMRSMHRGPTVGVDVAEARGITAEDVQAPASLWRWIASGDWRRGPPIVSVLMRSATVSTAQEMEVARQHSDVLILPELGPVEIPRLEGLRARRRGRVSGDCRGAVQARPAGRPAQAQARPRRDQGGGRRATMNSRGEREQHAPVRPRRHRLGDHAAIDVEERLPLGRVRQGLEVGAQARPAHPVHHGVFAAQDVQIGGGPDVDVGAERGEPAVVVLRRIDRLHAAHGRRAARPRAPSAPPGAAGGATPCRTTPAPGRRTRRPAPGVSTRRGNSRSWSPSHCRAALVKIRSGGAAGSKPAMSACSHSTASGRARARARASRDWSPGRARAPADSGA